MKQKMNSAKDNIERALRHLGLADYVSITLAHPDRIWGWPIGPFLRNHVEASNWMRDPKLAAESHHGEGAESFREPDGVHPALQVVFHPGEHGYEFVEIDLDKSAPVDVVDGILHGAEVLHNARTGQATNQDEIAAMLDRRFGGKA